MNSPKVRLGDADREERERAFKHVLDAGVVMWSRSARLGNADTTR